MKSLKQVLMLTIGLLIVISSLATGISVFMAAGSSTNRIIETQSISTLKGASNMLQLYLSNAFGGISRKDGKIVDGTGKAIDGRFEAIDEFSDALGVLATVFIKDGNDFTRIITNIEDDRGKRAVGTKLGTASQVHRVISSNQSFYGQAVILGKDYFTGYVPMLGENRDVIGIYFVGIPMEEILALVEKGRNETLTSAITFNIPLLLVSLIIIYGISKKIADPIKAITVTAKSIAQGDFDVSLAINSKTEIGELAKAFEETVKRLVNYQAYINEIGNALGEIAKGNLTVKLEREYEGQFSSLKVNMETLLINLNTTLWEIRNSAQTVEIGAQEVSSVTLALAEGATEQAAIVNVLTCSIEDITKNLKVSASNVEGTKEQVKLVDEEMSRSLDQANKMMKAMAVISDKSHEIAKIIRSIDEISFQTNILALNAAVEAGRAGQAGKGFTVIANEIRSLAGKSAESARYINQLIDETVIAVENGTTITGHTTLAISSLVENTKIVNSLIDRIAESAENQVILVENISMGAHQITSVVNTNAAISEENATVSERLFDQSITLSRLVSRFKLA